MIPLEEPEPSAPGDLRGRTVGLALLAFAIGLGGVGIGVGSVRFLWSAYLHGGL